MENKEKRNLSKIAFAGILILILIIALLYLYNIVRWGDKPDYGYAFRSATGIKTIGVVTETGRRAGIQLTDRILNVNGKTYNSIKELRSILNCKPGDTNTYLIRRKDKQFEVTIVNTRIGLKKVFLKSGLPYITGLLYVVIGSIIFLMKPHRRISWGFFLMTSSFGLLLMFLFKISAMRPAWLGTVHIFLYSFVPATFIHLAFSFPEERRFIRKQPYAQLLPYAVSTMIFLFIRSATSEMTGMPRMQFLLLISYFLIAVLFFLISSLHLWVTSTSEITKVRAKIILMGFSISASIPLADILSNAIFKIYLVPSFNYYLPFLLAFPLCIAYSIIKHNLFDIDIAIRRAFGYILITAGIALIYTLFVFIPSLLFGDFGQNKSHQFLFTIILIILLFFNFIRNRAQKYVDRIYYRLEFNYQEMIEKISQTMRSLLSIDQIIKHMIDIAENALFADMSYIMLLNKKEYAYECVAASFSVPPLPAGEPLIQKIAQRKREITRYDIEENPLFAIDRDICKDTFNRLKASLIIPLIYEDRLSGFMALGKKKSGKFYRYTDLLLLKTLANQGAVAIENARLFSELEEQTNSLTKTNLKLEQEVDYRQKAEAQLDKYRQQLEEKVERQTVEIDRSRKALADLKGDIKRGHRFGKIIGKSEPMQAIYALIQDLADVSATVLITGESGTGKELVAEALHTESQRKDHPFVKVNCSALSESILESELFGHVKGAFTGADKNKIGRFQKAADGAILLDEIGDVSLNFQKRLLRVLQEREFERLGDTTTLAMTARVMAATNQNLLERVNKGEFRQDLYYRLKVVEIKLPPLREHKEDIPLLIHHFLNNFNLELGKKIETVSPEALRILMAYHWPGNVRELRNTLEHICILCKNTTIVEDDLPSDFPGHDLSYDQSFQTLSDDDQPRSSKTLPDDKQTLLKALEKAQWNKTRAAEILGISRRTLYRRLKEYQI